MKILVGMSGGVDSAVVAALLKRDGHEVFGYTLKLLETTKGDESEGCCTFKDIRDAQMVCDTIGIEYLVTNWKKVFKTNVIDQYVAGAKEGIAYNPCVTCNSTVKLPVLFAVANHLHCDMVATGHYARIKNGRIARAANLAKDQSYFLWEADPKILERFVFPLGDIPSKDDTRKLAEEFGLTSVSKKKDSHDLCFFEGGTKTEFLEKHIPPATGKFVDNSTGKVVGTHEGFSNFVPGQRAKIAGSSSPRFVLKVLPSSNEVLVGSKEDAGVTEVIINRSRIVSGATDIPLWGVMRYRGVPAPIKAIRPLPGDLDNSRMVVEFQEMVFGVSPGQSLVFYGEDDTVFGGGVIEK